MQGSSWRVVAVLATIAIVAVVGCDEPRPSATAEPVTTPVATDGATISAPIATQVPAPTPQPLEPSSTELILAAEAAGAIDHPTAMLYRLFAQVADSRLPEQYRGEPSEDLAAADIAMAELAGYPADIQADMHPFLVRPTSPDSYWAPDASTASAALVAYYPHLTAASPCVNGWITRRADAPAKALIWGRCGGSVDDATVLSRVQEVATDMGQLWGPMTQLMGKEPIPDQNDPNSTADDGLPEAGDGLHDIYLINFVSTRYDRFMDSTGLAVNRQTYPAVGPASALQRASYSVFDVPASGTGPKLKSLLAHEFFHALERSWNSDGVIRAPATFWLVEANAQWSEHHFVPEARAIRDYPFYNEFLGVGTSLSSGTPARNGYLSWGWPLFIEQERGAPAIGAMWKVLEGKAGFSATMQAVDSILPFQNRFRDFAVRVWNENLQPGDPIDPRWQALDSSFPSGPPAGTPRHEATYTIPASQPSDPPHEFPTSLVSLWANYRELEPGPDVHQIVVDFSGLTPQQALDVDVLLKIKNEDWERRKLPTGKTRFCLDDDADAIEYAIVVLSNHDKNPSTTVAGKWTIQGLKQGCADLHGTLTITRDGTYHSVDGPAITRSEHLTATILVDMISDPDPFGGGGYIDDRSKFTIMRTTLESKQMGDCVATYATKSDGTWAFKDQPLGSDWENSITGFVAEIDPTTSYVVLAIVAHYPYTTTEDSCNLGPTPNLGVHDAFGCTGSSGLFGGFLEGRITEVAGGPDEVAFSCREVTEDEGGWTQLVTTVTGTLTLADRPGP